MATRKQGRGNAVAASTRDMPSGGTDVVQGDRTVLLFALTAFLAPALGSPRSELLPDTLKSAIVAFGVLVAATLFFWHQRNRRDGLRWHAILWLPVGLMMYALGSMAWAHTYLGGVETIRWFLFSLLLWLGANTLSRERIPLLAWGIHCGTVTAALWAALQFWFDFSFFPQGPNPGSTFANRNFFAEFATCTLPFSALLLARSRSRGQIALLAVTTALVIVSILMTGTRSALAAMWLQLLLILPVIGWLYRKQFAFAQWDGASRVLAIGLLLASVAGMGMIRTANPQLVEEARAQGKGLTALERGFKRTSRISMEDGSLAVRLVMWNATLRMIQLRPLSGVGAGNWESDIPLYQAEGTQAETDFYVHNEFLQLLGEYGLAGWLFLLLLLAYLVQAAWRTLRNPSAAAQAEAPFRAAALCSLFALFVVSNVGFPWRLASTGALFAMCLAVLAASDSRLAYTGWGGAQRINWRPAFSQAMAIVMMVTLAMAAYITQQAVASEDRIIKATIIALTISSSGDYQNPRWDKMKLDMLRLIKEGIDINPHYRRITPKVADELAKWGDWKNAVWIWESVLSSRPYVVAIMTNVARGHALTGSEDKALVYLARAKKLQPYASSVRSLEVVLLSKMGQEAKAMELARDAINHNAYDYDLVNAGFVLGWRGGDFPLAVQSMELRIKDWPDTRAQGLVQLGNLYATGIRNEPKALASYKAGVAAMLPAERDALIAQIPQAFWARLGIVARSALAVARPAQ